MRRKKKWIALIIVSIIAVGGGWAISAIKHLTGENGNVIDLVSSMTNPRGQFPEAKNRVNILLLGKDYSYLWKTPDIKLKGARYSKESRSDTIMLLSLDFDKKSISALSIPRDTRVTAPDGKTGKINATYRRGGAKLVAETVGELLGVKPDYYITVTPDALKLLVDQLGGVTVETIDAMQYNDAAAGLHIDLPKGQQVINGTQAIGFARFREADIYERNPDGTAIFTGRKDSQGNPIFVRRRVVQHSLEETDMRRTARQQQLIRAMVTEAKQPKNLPKVGGLIDTAFSQIETDMARMQLIALAALFKDAKPDQMQSATLEGRDTKIGGTYYLVLDERKTHAMVDWLIKGDESAANSLTVVKVQNGTDIPNAARHAADLLRDQGFDAKSSGKAVTETVPETTQILYGKAVLAPRAQRIADLLGGGTLTKQPVESLGGADVTVVLGRDVATHFAEKRASL